MEAFDPIERAREVEKIVVKGDQRLYYKFRYQEYYNGVATADTIGCNILCAYCWNYARNQNPAATKGAVFKTPGEVAIRLNGICEKKRINTVRISGAEPFLGEASTKHLAEVLKLCKGREFIIETNGLMLGFKPELIDLIKPFKPYVRLTIKGDSNDQFEKVTGAKGEFFDYQLEAYHELKKRHVETGIAIMPEFVSYRTIKSMVQHQIETEGLIPYGGIGKRLKERGIEKYK